MWIEFVNTVDEHGTQPHNVKTWKSEPGPLEGICRHLNHVYHDLSGPQVPKAQSLLEIQHKDLHIERTNANWSS